ncbi:unnamed protein product [Malus baccata var. baccata]
MQFIHYLMDEKVPVEEHKYKESMLKNVQSQLVEMVQRNDYLRKSAKEAYKSYLLAYNSHSMKDIFNVHRLDLQAVAASFCFLSPPKMNLNLNSNASKFRKKMSKVKGSRNGFSGSNPYGRQKGRDEIRQFVRH